ncbi:MAG TPA: nucleotide exchange factor GrpE [Burkholderiales bacterium]|jgi:molecular chaperone GrpE|nr:nucleotide exchange factor GrpE [Burkholderiales bacterium]
MQDKPRIEPRLNADPDETIKPQEKPTAAPRAKSEDRAPASTDRTPTPAQRAPASADRTPAAAGADEATRAAAGHADAALQERLKQAEQAVQEHREAWLRAVAEADNIRKRTRAEASNAQRFAIESFAKELLAVRDSLEAALAADNTTVEALKNGVELTLRQLDAAFSRFNVTEVNPQGEKFDPHRHEAMTTIESDAEPNTVINVLQKGYVLHDRVLRPALVTVAKSKSVES